MEPLLLLVKFASAAASCAAPRGGPAALGLAWLGLARLVFCLLLKVQTMVTRESYCWPVTCILSNYSSMWSMGSPSPSLVAPAVPWTMVPEAPIRFCVAGVVVLWFFLFRLYAAVWIARPFLHGLMTRVDLLAADLLALAVASAKYAAFD